MKYSIKANWWLKQFYPGCIWKIPVTEDILYLSFDDGPDPEITPWVLDVLKTFNAKATFFCVGKNVRDYPQIYSRILEEGHRTGNHSFSHLNGWKVPNKEYIDDIIKAREYIDSTLFRPPYGRISSFQRKLLTGKSESRNKLFDIIMWDVLSGDFDLSMTAEKCKENVIKNAEKGSIVTFHDSRKAFPRLKEALPKVMEYFSEKGFRFETIPV